MMSSSIISSSISSSSPSSSSSSSCSTAVSASASFSTPPPSSSSSTSSICLSTTNATSNTNKRTNNSKYANGGNKRIRNTTKSNNNNRNNRNNKNLKTATATSGRRKTKPTNVIETIIDESSIEYQRNVVYHCYRENRSTQDAFLHLGRIYRNTNVDDNNSSSRSGGQFVITHAQIDNWYNQFRQFRSSWMRCNSNANTNTTTTTTTTTKIPTPTSTAMLVSSSSSVLLTPPTPNHQDPYGTQLSLLPTQQPPITVTSNNRLYGGDNQRVKNCQSSLHSPNRNRSDERNNTTPIAIPNGAIEHQHHRTAAVTNFDNVTNVGEDRYGIQCLNEHNNNNNNNYHQMYQHIPPPLPPPLAPPTLAPSSSSSSSSSSTSSTSSSPSSLHAYHNNNVSNGQHHQHNSQQHQHHQHHSHSHPQPHQNHHNHHHLSHQQQQHHHHHQASQQHQQQQRHQMDPMLSSAHPLNQHNNNHSNHHHNNLNAHPIISAPPDTIDSIFFGQLSDVDDGIYEDCEPDHDPVSMSATAADTTDAMSDNLSQYSLNFSSLEDIDTSFGSTIMIGGTSAVNGGGGTSSGCATMFGSSNGNSNGSSAGSSNQGSGAMMLTPMMSAVLSPGSVGSAGSGTSSANFFGNPLNHQHQHPHHYQQQQQQQSHIPPLSSLLPQSHPLAHPYVSPLQASPHPVHPAHSPSIASPHLQPLQQQQQQQQQLSTSSSLIIDPHSHHHHHHQTSSPQYSTLITPATTTNNHLHHPNDHIHNNNNNYQRQQQHQSDLAPPPPAPPLPQSRSQANLGGMKEARKITEEQVDEFMLDNPNASSLEIEEYFGVDIETMSKRMRRLNYWMDQNRNYRWTKKEALTDEKLRQYVDALGGAASARKVAEKFHIGRGMATKRLKALGLFNLKKQPIKNSANSATVTAVATT